MKFVQIKNSIIMNVALSDNAKVIYAYLKTHDLEKFSPSYKKIMEDLNKSKSTVFRGLRELQNCNLIMTVPGSYLKIEFID